MTRVAVLLAILGVVIAGAAAEVALRPRLLPQPDAPLKSATQLQPVTQGQVEAILARDARDLDEGLRKQLADAILTESVRAGYDPLFVLALVSVESRFRVTVSSERGAYGLMQMKPSTFAWIAGREPDLDDDAQVSEDPVIDVRLAVRYFKYLEHRFHSRNEALMAYNAGPKRFLHYKRAGEFPDSLREYPRRIRKEYQRFVQLCGRTMAADDVMLARNN